MNHLEMSNRLLMEELLSLEALLRLMQGREASEWMLNNVKSLLYSLKSRAFLAKKLSMADVIHFMQKLLIEMPFSMVLDLLLKSVDVCIKAFDNTNPVDLINELLSSYEQKIKTMQDAPAMPATLQLVRNS